MSAGWRNRNAPRGGSAANHWRSQPKRRAGRQPGPLRSAARARQRVVATLRRFAEAEGNRSGDRSRLRSRQSNTRSRSRLPTAMLLWVALALVASNLTLVALRSDLTRVRYALSHGATELQQLDQENRALTLKLGELRDPRRLAEIARARGFAPPERIVELP